MKLTKSKFVRHLDYKGPRLEWLYRQSWPIEECIPSHRIGLQIISKEFLYGIISETEEEEELFKNCGDYIY